MFKWIKQQPRIEASFGTSKNGVKPQIWIAISVGVRVAIVKERLGAEAKRHKILPLLSAKFAVQRFLDKRL